MERDSHDEWTDDYAEEPKTPRGTPAAFQTSDKDSHDEWADDYAEEPKTPRGTPAAFQTSDKFASGGAGQGSSAAFHKRRVATALQNLAKAKQECDAAVKAAEHSSTGAKTISARDPPSEVPSELDAGMLAVRAARGQLRGHARPLSRAWTLLAYVGDGGGGEGGVLRELQKRAGGVEEGLKGTEDALAARKAALLPLLAGREAISPGAVAYRAARTAARFPLIAGREAISPGAVAYRAASMIGLVNGQRIAAAAACQAAGEEIKRVYAQASPVHNKSAFLVKGFDSEETPADGFDSEETPADVNPQP
ncbi:hypothetical protein T484DRAFT_1773114 [Baffinella frigidus]|nr:hypothetical protein T484DRAFT_1773114 [Cryptophyta sp. CCMP2293]